jgi:hypothetical protein
MNLFSSPKHPNWLVRPTRLHIQLVTWTLPLEVKWSHHEAHHSSTSQAKVKNVWSYISTPPFVLIAYTRPILLSLSHIYIYIYIYIYNVFFTVLRTSVALHSFISYKCITADTNYKTSSQCTQFWY